MKSVKRIRKEIAVIEATLDHPKFTFSRMDQAALVGVLLALKWVVEPVGEIQLEVRARKRRVSRHAH